MSSFIKARDTPTHRQSCFARALLWRNLNGCVEAFKGGTDVHVALHATPEPARFGYCEPDVGVLASGWFYDVKVTFGAV